MVQRAWTVRHFIIIIIVQTGVMYQKQSGAVFSTSASQHKGNVCMFSLSTQTCRLGLGQLGIKLPVGVNSSVFVVVCVEMSTFEQCQQLQLPSTDRWCDGWMERWCVIS